MGPLNNRLVGIRQRIPVNADVELLELPWADARQNVVVIRRQGMCEYEHAVRSCTDVHGEYLSLVKLGVVPDFRFLLRAAPLRHEQRKLVAGQRRARLVHEWHALAHPCRRDAKTCTCCHNEKFFAPSSSTRQSRPFTVMFGYRQ